MVCCMNSKVTKRHYMLNVSTQETNAFASVYKPDSLRLGLNSSFSGETKVVHHYLLQTPPFPFQHHTELRYQLTHYPLSPGD